MRKYGFGRAVSLAASYNGHLTHNRLIVSQYKKKDKDKNIIPKAERHTRFFKIFNNFMQGHLTCEPLTEYALL